MREECREGGGADQLKRGGKLVEKDGKQDVTGDNGGKGEEHERLDSPSPCFLLPHEIRTHRNQSITTSPAFSGFFQSSLVRCPSLTFFTSLMVAMRKRRGTFLPSLVASSVQRCHRKGTCVRSIPMPFGRSLGTSAEGQAMQGVRGRRSERTAKTGTCRQHLFSAPQQSLAVGNKDTEDHSPERAD